MKKIIASRFSAYFWLIFIYLILSSFVRIGLTVFVINKINFSFLGLVKILFVGFYFDSAVAIYFSSFYLIYLMLIPRKIIGSTFDKITTYVSLFLTLFLILFSLGSELPFWDEFSARFNFIAVDYLIYTYEVIENINQSYPIPILVFILFVFIGTIFYYFKKKNIFENTFTTKTPIKVRFTFGVFIIFIAISHTFLSNNKQAEWSTNFYENELSKNGVYSFFAAYISNELDYQTFYQTLNEKKAYLILKKELLQKNEKYTKNEYSSIQRQVINNKLTEKKSNIILIAIESFSADFLHKYGNTQKLTPNYDQLIKESIVFNNMYATGTRTVRGMEALTLCVPPTPGNSIVRRPNNDNLYSIANPLKERNYSLKFIYGGDGYFDNMNSFFGGQGFDIVDRNRGNPLSDKIKTKRYNIPNTEVEFENAWGISDEDIYKQAIKYATLDSKKKKPFFQFIMTTSNHKPYTFPKNKINMDQGSREGAVKYTDYALGQFIHNAKKMPWFKNTVFVIVADHCASSAGKWEINIEKHHIPAILYNFNQHKEVNNLSSQIDLMPTVFSLLNWKFKSEFYGKNIMAFESKNDRALIGNYRTLGLLKNNTFTQLNDTKSYKQFYWSFQNKSMVESKNQVNKSLVDLTIAYYQTASNRFKKGKMKNTHYVPKNRHHHTFS